MSPTPAQREETGSLQRAYLWARVQLDGFRADRWTYIKALWWRLFRKRVRSWSMIEPLIGKSPHAYALWQARHNDVRISVRRDAAAGPVQIMIGLDLNGGQNGLAETFASLGELGAHTVCAQLGAPGLDHIVTPQPPFWICPLRPGDRLAADSLAAYAAAASATEKTIIYADDDLLDDQGRRHAPHFKPGWNPELYRWHDFLSHSCLLRIDDLAELNELVERSDWVTELIARRLASNPFNAAHLPQLLHHRRVRPSPRFPLPADTEQRPETLPAVTVIVPTRNRVELLRNCIDGLHRTSYPQLDLIVIDNDSDDPATLTYLRDIAGKDCKILPYHGAFNYAAMNNAAAAIATGDLLCFLNNDIEMLDDDWLIHLVRQAVLPNVGAVGARLLYADGSIQHAGVVIGVGGGAAHAHRNLRPEDEGYFARHNLPQFVSAVTAACLVVRRDHFLAVGGFDEQRFPVAFNDVDLCLKLNEQGWQSFYEPRATLVHHESKSRGKDSHRSNRDRFAAELSALKTRWHTDAVTDPYHHPSLSQYSEQFVLRL
ncbi:MAG: glycosyltransferase [Sphingobium sp.]|nr:glycosyltransferase [Sphingobium sp.]